MSDGHYSYVREADPCGMVRMHEAACGCGWVSESTDDEREAKRFSDEHRRDNYRDALEQIVSLSDEDKHGGSDDTTEGYWAAIDIARAALGGGRDG